MKKLLPYLVGALAALVLVAGGMVTGAMTGITWGSAMCMNWDTMYVENMRRLVMNKSVLMEIDSGKLSDARDGLNSEIYYAAHTLAYIYTDLEDENKKIAIANQLKLFSEYQKENPAGNIEDFIHSKIQEVIQAAEKEQLDIN